MFDISKKQNLLGQKFGNFLVLKQTNERDSYGNIIYVCQCQCEDKTIKKLSTKQLKHTKNLSCGCENGKDLTGLTFGRWTVLKRNGKNKHGSIMWDCICNCENKTIKTLASPQLIHGYSKSCGCIQKELGWSKRLDLINQRFGRLIVVKRAEDKIRPTMRADTYWICRCDCGNEITVATSSLTGGITNSCGCLAYDLLRKYNDFYIGEKYGVGYTLKDIAFYFDKEDFEKIKDYYWSIDSDGYIYTKVKNTDIQLHRLVMDVNNPKLYTDHIYHNPQDNRKEYLRIVTNQQNCFNQKLHKNNSSGVKGVYWNTQANKWIAEIRYNDKKYGKSFIDFDEAIKYRKYLEEKYFGDFNYQEPPPEYLEELEQLKQQAEQNKN